jgi:hypothetical protein
MLGGVVIEVVTLPTEDNTLLFSVTVIVGVDVTLTVILEITVVGFGQVFGEARDEDGVVDGDVDEGAEELDDLDVEEDSVTTQEHALDSLEADDV